MPRCRPKPPATSPPPTLTGADLIVLRPQGLYCPAGDFYIDPWRPVDRAVITHAHADHARAGHGHYLASADGAGVLRARLGDISAADPGLWRGGALGRRARQPAPGRPCAGLGAGAAWNTAARSGWPRATTSSAAAATRNPSCTPFEPVRCHCFITESTFGLPIYRWRPQAEVLADINAWWQRQRRRRPRQPAAGLQLRQGAAPAGGGRCRRSARSSCTARWSR